MMTPARLLGAITHRNVRRVGECMQLHRWLAAAPGEKILDVGCGDGYQTMRIAASGARVTGIDIDRRKLSRAAGLYRHPNCECRYMNAEEMDFPAASFDKVVSFCVIEHFQSNERVLQHIARVIKPGGLLVFSADSLSAAGVTGAERERHRHRYHVEVFFDPSVVREKLERHGFELLETRYILTTPRSVSLCRLSWRLERLGRGWAPLTGAGNLLLGTVGNWAMERSERIAAAPTGGMTLLVRARRSAAAPA